MPRKKPTDTGEFRAQLEQAKTASTLQILFKVSRLLDELALSRVAQRQAGPRLRRSHTSLLPHLDLAGTRLTDLAERLGITKQAVSQLVDDLEGYGILAREADPDDARAKRIVFTEKGKKSLLEGLGVLHQLERELSASIGAERMAELRSALLSILAHVQA